MERFLLPSKRSRNCSLVPSENENINVNLPDVENVSDVDSETEESADAFAADAETAASTTSSSIQISNTRSSFKGPMDLSQKPDEGPRRPIRKYPAQMFGNQQRSFQSGWGRPEQRLGTLGHQYKKSEGFGSSAHH